MAAKVSIITAAYNRSNVLRHAIASVVNQDFDDWEHIIVGDGCTDDTAEVVAGFGNDRVRFVNLPENSGGQSAPNNHALSLARGEVILFLNQDDFYLPGHVARSVDFLAASGADIAWSPVALPMATNRNSLDWRVSEVRIDGITPDSRFDPATFIIASSWAMRADAARRVGPWLPADRTSVSPSQEWLFRAHRMGLELAFDKCVSVLCIHSGARRNSYATRDAAEHEMWFQLVWDDPAGMAKLLERAAITEAQLRVALAADTASGKGLARRAAARLGLHPHALGNRLRYRRHGGFVAWHRQYVVEAQQLPVGTPVAAGSSQAEGYFGFGWSPGEGTHRWQEGPRAELAFAVADPRARTLRLTGAPYVAQPVTFTIAGGPALTVDWGTLPQSVDLALTASSGRGGLRLVHVTVEVAEPRSPQQVAGLSDPRLLGFRLESLEVLQ